MLKNRRVGSDRVLHQSFLQTLYILFLSEGSAMAESKPVASKRAKQESKVAFSLKDVGPGKHLQISCSAFPDFCSFIEGSDPHAIVDFFRDVLLELEKERRLRDFHLKLRGRTASSGSGFVFDVFYGYGEKCGPVTVAPRECISCFADVVLYPDKEPKVTSGDCILEEMDGDGLVRCSIDAKGRPGFIVTPVRHVERMSDLGNDELLALWRTSVEALRCHGLSAFRCMILNHGTYRNLPHLHLKIWVDRASYSRACLSWPSSRKELWKRLEALAGDNPLRKCRFYQSKQGCRDGARCKFLHE